MNYYEVTVAEIRDKTFTVAARSETEAKEITKAIIDTTDLLDLEGEEPTTLISDITELEDDEDVCDECAGYTDNIKTFFDPFNPPSGSRKTD